MKLRIWIITPLVSLLPMFSSATSFSEISTFAQDICDKVSTSGSISNTKIIGSLNAKAGTLVKLIGGSIGVDGSVIVDNVKYDGISQEELPAQMADARACRKELAILLLAKQEVIQTIKSTSLGNTTKYRLSNKGFDVALMSQPDFKSFSNPMSSDNKILKLIEGTQLKLTPDKYEETVNGISVLWRKVIIASGEGNGAKGWILQNNIEEF